MSEDEVLFEVTVHLKTGQTVTFRSRKWVQTRNRVTRDLVGIEWQDVPGCPRLKYLDLDQIAAVVLTDVSEAVPES